MSQENSRMEDPGGARTELSRRTFLKGAGLTIAAVGVTGPVAAASQEGLTTSEVPVVGPGRVELELIINGARRKIAVEPWVTLLDLLRDRIGLTGSKRCCDRGSCGACTVLVGDRPVCSCTMLAIDAAGRQIITIEGIASGEQLSDLQKAFVECDAMQCGFCTPGMVVAGTALLRRNEKPTRDEIAEGIAGNICRCGAYQNIFEAVARAAGEGGGRARF
ncbi:MAG: (2Fe-2S)-binding protein [Planctomycetota bacterium]